MQKYSKDIDFTVSMDASCQDKSRYICVLDFEATCWEGTTDLLSRQEIIEFPSILFELTPTREFRFISEFSRYVKPVLEPLLSEFCTRLTGITQEQVSAAEPIEVVYNDHHAWLCSHVPLTSYTDIYIVTSGGWDLETMLPKEVSNKELPYYDVYKRYINVNVEFEDFYRKMSVNMSRMMQYLQLELEGRLHSGIDDTRNIARIFTRLIADGHVSFTILHADDKNF